MIYSTIAESNEATVVAEYTPTKSKSSAYQSEADLEKEFIRLLSNQGYEYIQRMPKTPKIWPSSLPTKTMVL